MRPLGYLLVGALVLGGIIWFSLWSDPATRNSHSPQVLPLPELRKASKTPAPAETPTAGPRGMFSEFQTLSDVTLDSLPLVEDLRRKPFDPHFSPPELLATAPALAKIADALNAHSELIPQGIEFYHACARREGVLTPIRALCYRYLQHWARVQPDVMTVAPENYPENVVRLSYKLSRMIP